MKRLRSSNNTLTRPTKAFSICLLILCFLLPYSGAFARSENTDPITLGNNQTLAQSLTAIYRGFNKFGFLILTEKPTQGSLELKIFKNALEKELVFQQKYPINSTTTEYTPLEFPALSDSNLQDYYLELTWEGNEPLIFQTQSPFDYDQGSLYFENTPIQAQLDFDLGYNRIQQFIGLFGTLLTWAWQLFLTCLLLILPGWAAFSVIWRRWQSYDTPTKLALAAGFSVALYPLLFLISGFIKLQPGEIGLVWLPIAISIITLIIRHQKSLRSIQLKSLFGNLSFHDWFMEKIKAHWFMVLVFFIIVFTRLWAIRTVEIPLWNDSYQHTIITQLMLDHGGLFNSWRPYAEYSTLTIHFGFHALSTVYAWISNATASQSVIWMGQMLNILSVLSIYPLAKRIANDRKWAGVMALVLAALVFKYPQFYVNWGRFPQLTGQVLLPLIPFLLIEGLLTQDAGYKDQILIPVFIGGMAVNYFRMPFFMLLWLPLLVYEFVRWVRTPGISVPVFFKKLGIVILIPALIGIFLFLRISTGALAENAASISATDFESSFTMVRNTLKGIKYYYDPFYLCLAFVSLILGVLKKNWKPLLIMVGFFLLSAFYLGRVINIPFSSYIDGFSIQIMTYIPLGILVAYLVGELFAYLESKNRFLPQMIMIVIVFFSAYHSKNITNKLTYELATKPDLRAFEWIKQNTAPNDLFLVNGYNIYNDTSSVGSDGGWWIPLLTGRPNTMPPQYALLNEKPFDPDYSQLIPEMILRLEVDNPASRKGTEALCEWGVDYIYIGQKQGAVNGAVPLLKWQEWSENELLSPVYLQDHVRIYRFDRSTCDGKE